MAKRPSPSFLIFRDKQGHWRWNFVGPGGRVLAASAQAYARSDGCVRAIRALKGSADVPVVGSAGDVQAAKELRAAAGQTTGGAAKAADKKAAETAKSVEKAPVKKKV